MTNLSKSASPSEDKVTRDNEIRKGFSVSIRTHTVDAINKLDSPDLVRSILGTALDKVGLDEEVDYTLEVKRIYEYGA